MAGVLSKGANAPLPTPDVRVEVSSSTPLDIAALLLTPAGKVRSDADFVFYNQPTGPGVRLIPPSSLEFSLGAVPPDIDKVVVTGSLDGTGPTTFATVRGLTVTVRDSRGGTEIVRFVPEGLGLETALLMVELYRRAGTWKVRAVGQGYATGLAGIATDFGISVDDPGPAAAQPAAPARPAQPGTTGPAGGWPAQNEQMFEAPTQLVRPDAPAAPAPQPTQAPPMPAGQPWGAPPPGPGGQPGYGQPQPGYGQPPTAPGGGQQLGPPPPPPGQPQQWGGQPGGWGPPAGPPANQQQWGPPQGPPSGGYQQGGGQWGAPAGPPAAGAVGAVNLDKGRVSLRKGEAVSLVKTGAPPLTRVRMALGWDPAMQGRSIDLDASCILYDAHGKDVDKVWFMSKKGAKGAVRHSGDNLTGQGEGDDEVILVDLGALPPTVLTLVFTVNSFQGQPFTEVRRAYCRLVDDLTGQELVRFDLSESKPATGLVMCKVQRVPNGPVWTMTAIGEFHDGKTVRAMVEPSRRYL